LGIEPPAGAGSESFEPEDPPQMRDRRLSAGRPVVEAARRREPMIFAVEDIHWADEGMLDLIEYLARWTRAPVLMICLARDELLDRRPGWAGGRINATRMTLEPLPREEAKALVTTLMPGTDAGVAGGDLVEQVAERSGGNPLFAEEMVNRIVEGGGADTESLPETVHSVLAARLDSLPRDERRVLQAASVVGHTFWEGSVDPGDISIDLTEALGSLQEKDLVVPTAGSRLAGQREYAFKHVLIRDVAYSTLPKAVRARRHAEVGSFISARAADRSEGVIAMVAEHYGRAASLGAAADLEPGELEQIEERALEALEAAGDASAGLYSNREAQGHYESALGLDGRLEPAARARIAEKLGDVALRLGRVDRAVRAWEDALDYHRGQEDLARVGDLHRKIGAGLWHKGDREGSIEHYQRGIDLLKDGPPCIELVRLYEEAASLYMHTGDNMLAIYASEKALRLAERLGEAAAASRAHGIFGRVFGRIGDSERARENLERSVELARESDPAEAVRALLALGYHLEISEADYDGAAGAYGDALAIALRTGDLPAQVELHAALAQVAAYRGDWESCERETDSSQTLAERQGLIGKFCFPYSIRGVLLAHQGELDAAVEILERAVESATQVGRSEIAFESLHGLASAQRDRGDHAAADAALLRALDLCERAGLVAQSIEATAARAVNLALWGRTEAAVEAAEEAAGLAERLRYPVGVASGIEARGAATADPALLAEAEAAWTELGRPDNARRSAELAARLGARR
ncbi:MAG: tetratricopeptide repeat protein, partial [Solirubrobacterales bacterium]